MNLLDYAEGVRRRDEGVERVKLSNASFVSYMQAEAAMLLCKHDTITIDDLREIAIDRDIWPEHPNAWGAIFRSSLFEWVSMVQSKWPGNHARMIKVWKLR